MAALDAKRAAAKQTDTTFNHNQISFEERR
jgi:hypothetical protein